MSDREEIDAEVKRFAKAYESGDLATLMSIYTDDLIKSRNDSPCESKMQTEQRIARVFAEFNGKLKVDNQEIVVCGEMAYIRGAFEVEITPRGGGVSRWLRRRFLEIWRKENGHWRVSRTMDNVEGL